MGGGGPMTKVSKGYTVEEGVFYYLGEYSTDADWELCQYILQCRVCLGLSIAFHLVCLMRCVLCTTNRRAGGHQAWSGGEQCGESAQYRPGPAPAPPSRQPPGGCCRARQAGEAGRAARRLRARDSRGDPRARLRPEGAWRVAATFYYLATATQTHVSKARHLCEPKP